MSHVLRSQRSTPTSVRVQGDPHDRRPHLRGASARSLQRYGRKGPLQLHGGGVHRYHYKIDTPHGEVRRIVERLPINAPACGSLYFQTVLGMGRVEEILRTKGLSLADANAAGGIRALPGLLEGSVICVITRNRWTAGFNCPVVDRVEALDEDNA